MYSGTTFDNSRGTGKAQQLADSIRADQRSEREQKFREILKRVDRIEEGIVAVLGDSRRLTAAAENAERVMDDVAHKLARLPYNDLAMDLLEAAKQLKTARGAV